MPNLETPSELADHLADLLGIGQDSRCQVIGWDNPLNFIGPIPEHIQDCDCRVFWILEMTDRIRRSVINEITFDLSAFKRPATKSITFDTNDMGRFTGRFRSNKSNLKSVDTIADGNKGMEVGKFIPTIRSISGRLGYRGPELQDPRGLDIEKVEHNKYFDMDYADMELKVFATLSKEDKEDVITMYDKVEGKTSMQITAFIESKEKTWIHELEIRNSTYTQGQKVLSINPPNIGYNIDKYFLTLFDDDKRRAFILNSGEEVLCIDAGGRNYGVKESVYVLVEDLRTYLIQEGILSK